MAMKTWVSKDKLLYFWQLLKGKLNTKVDKVSGKGLSESDFTAAEKSKLSGVAAGAQVNVLEGVKVNGAALTPTGKLVSITIPTDVTTAAELTAALAPYAKTAVVPTKVSQLSNDSAYQTSAQVTSTVNSAIAGVTTFSFVIVTALPTTGQKSNHIYLLPKSGGTQDSYDEWAWIEAKWEHIGQTDVDLSGYVKEAEMTEITNAEIDTIFAS